MLLCPADFPADGNEFFSFRSGVEMIVAELLVESLGESILWTEECVRLVTGGQRLLWSSTLL